jgi:light-regulated signal transduction histidine kinase (bacteriophytochrome)
LIDDLISFSRMGRREMMDTACDLTALTREVYEQFDPTVRGRVKRFDLKPMPSAAGDAPMLRQALFNLLDNALKFSGTRPEPAIEVGGSTAGGWNTYYVKDNGIGYDPRHADKLFQVFQRLHGSEEFEGSGVGLALVKRIVERHGGKVWAETTPTEGSTFYFTLRTPAGA